MALDIAFTQVTVNRFKAKTTYYANQAMASLGLRNKPRISRKRCCLSGYSLTLFKLFG